MDLSTANRFWLSSSIILILFFNCNNQNQSPNEKKTTRSDSAISWSASPQSTSIKDFVNLLKIIPEEPLPMIDSSTFENIINGVNLNEEWVERLQIKKLM